MHSDFVIHIEHCSVELAFAKEAELVEAIRLGDTTEGLLLWQPDSATLVLPASKRWQATEPLLVELNASHWQLFQRRTGGAPVPQVPGIINVSHVALWQQTANYSIKQGYRDLCARLQAFFTELGIATQIHATADSYCDGDYNLNINGRKIVGTAQRVMRNGIGQQIVLAQACILIDVLVDELVKPVNLCNQHNAMTERVKAEVHTCLREHLAAVPTTQTLYQQLTKAFLP